MTVKELIEELKKFDPELEVGFVDDGMLQIVSSLTLDSRRCVWNKGKEVLLIW